MLVELVGNGTMREHRSIDGNESFDEFRREPMVLVDLRSRRNGVGSSGWWVHRRGFSFLLYKPRKSVPKPSQCSWRRIAKSTIQNNQKSGPSLSGVDSR